jgi:hypothetical protein
MSENEMKEIAKGLEDTLASSKKMWETDKNHAYIIGFLEGNIHNALIAINRHIRETGDAEDKL